MKIPSVAAFVVTGVLLGSSGFNLFNDHVLAEVSIINNIALGLIALVIGGELQWSHLKKLGKSVFVITAGEALGAFILVTITIQLLFNNLPLALLLGSISAATAPAATVMVIKEMKATGPFTKTLLAIVAIDDAFALLIFGVCSAIAISLLSGSVFSLKAVTLSAATQIGGALILGFIGAVLITPLLRRFRNSESNFIVVIGVLFLLLGITEQFGLSELLTSMIYGMIVSNFCPIASKKIFQTLSKISAPLYIAFFVTAGAHLKLALFPQIWKLGVIYIVCRILGKIIGASVGAHLSDAQDSVKKYIGFGLLSQVGVAVGLAMVVGSKFESVGTGGSHMATIIINVLLTTTLFTEIVGPLMTKYALVKSNEAKK